MSTFTHHLKTVLLLAAGGLVALLLGWGAEAAEPGAGHETVCGARASVLTTLDGKYAERPSAMGLASNGTVVEVLNSDDGSWTIIMTAPNGVSCLLAAGDYWQDVPRPSAELKM